jgi:Fe-S-cluster containining protein
MPRLKALLQKDDPFLKPVRLAGNSFPGIWTEMMPKGLFSLRFPEERRATCMNCPKSCYDSFRPDYRCCTYHPRISNFLLGLGSETEAGDRAIDRLLARGMLLPEGMYSTPGQWIDFLDDQQQDSFGSSNKVLCPMLDEKTGFCDVHAFRNAVCSTFFCFSDHGQTGENFWVQVQTLGSQIELVLAQWSLAKAGFDLDRYFKAFDGLASKIHEVSTPTGWTEEALDALWGEWRGREKELMRECAAIITEHRQDLWSIANSQAIRESIPFDRAMDTIVPEHLEDEVEGEELEEGDEITLRPSDTWEECLEAHARLWNWPQGVYVLSPNVSFVDNKRIDAEEQFYKDKDVFIEYRFAKDQDFEWRLGITQVERNFLKNFAAEGRTLDNSLFDAEGAQALPHLRDFLTEMHNRKVLWPKKN